MPQKRKKFRYKRRSPFQVLLHLAKYEFDNIDRFLALAKSARNSEVDLLERVAAKRLGNAPDDDWLVGDFAQLEDFAALSAEFAIVALWRCIELYRKSAMRVAAGQAAAQSAFRHREFQKGLSKLGIAETRIRYARSVDELRCLNNAIKHHQHVDGELANFPRWRRKKGRKLGNLEAHYARLRLAAAHYLDDLAARLGRRPFPIADVESQPSRHKGAMR